MNDIINLVKKAQKGNDKAFLKLFQQYEQDIYRVAFVYVKNKEDALDIVQEVAYRSFKRIDTLENPEHVKSWLLTITIRCAIDCLTKRKKVVQLKPDYEESVQENDRDLSLSLSLQDLLDKLTPDEKSIILLKYYEDYSFKDISKLLHIPLGTAKSTLYRALSKLRKHVSEADMYEQ